MQIHDIPANQLKEAPWNTNQMDGNMVKRLKESLNRYGVVVPLVVRPLAASGYEVVNGNQRFRVLVSMKVQSIPCVIVDVNDAEAMLMSQALNSLHGDDDLALKGELLKKVLETIPEERVLDLLPETANSLKTLSSISQTDLAQHLQAWDRAQSARLKHLQLQLTGKQLEVVEEAVSIIQTTVKVEGNENPNRRSNAVYLLCKYYLENRRPE